MATNIIAPHAIPDEWAEYLCREVCHQGEHSGFSLAKAYCWVSHLFTDQEAPVRCYCRKAGNSGCALVNARDRHYYWAFHKS